MSVGGDPRTDQEICVEPSSVVTGGDPKTDHSLFVGMACVDSPLTGGLATQTATTSPACTDHGISSAFSRDSEVRDGCSSSAEVSEYRDGLTTIVGDPEQRDAFPSSAEVSDHRDGFPRAGVMEYSEYSHSVFSWDFYTDENSERLRESDSGVQIVPASGSPSELSAHQMGLSLAGASRLRDEPIHSIAGTSALAITEHEQLSISDRALLRKFGLAGRGQESTREPEAHHGTIPIVQRVDGHPPRADLNLYDRMLLRKYTLSCDCFYVFSFLLTGFGSTLFASS